MQLQQVNSGTVSAIGYEIDGEVVHVLFRDNTYYKYSPVPHGVYEGLLKAQSKGSYIHKMAKLYQGEKQ